MSVGLAFFLSASAGQSADVPHVVRDTGAPCVRFRPEPDTSVSHTGCLAPGTSVVSFDAVPFWRHVRLGDGRDGWVAKKFLEPDPSPPVVPPPSTFPADAILEVHFVDVGQGDAIWIRTHDDGVGGNGIFEGKNVIIDGGPNSADHSNELLKYLQEPNNAHHGAVIDALILSHPHTDHFRGADTMFRHFDIASYYDAGFDSSLSSYAAYLSQAEGETLSGGAPAKIMVGGDEFEPLDLGSEVKAEFLYVYDAAAGHDLGSGNTEVNNSSLVFRLEYGEHVFLFMGDAEGKHRDDDGDEDAMFVERILLDDVSAEKLRANVLKAGHHGSESGSTEEFLKVVKPEVVVVQSGRQSFGGTFLPDGSTLERICCLDPAPRIFRTDQGDEGAGLTGANDTDGDHVVIRSNGAGDLDVAALSGGASIAMTDCEPGCPP